MLVGWAVRHVCIAIIFAFMVLITRLGLFMQTRFDTEMCCAFVNCLSFHMPPLCVPGYV